MQHIQSKNKTKQTKQNKSNDMSVRESPDV